METSQSASFSAIRRVLLRQWATVVSIAVVALVASFASVVGRASSYEVTAQFLIVPLSQDDQIYFGTGMLRDAGDPSLTAASAAQVLHTEDIARAAAGIIGPGATSSQVLARVQVRPSPETNVLQVTATAGSPAEAGRLATAYVASVVGVRWQLVSRDIVRRIAILRSRGDATSDTRVAALQETLAGGSDPTVQLAQPASPAKTVSHTPAPVLVLLGLLGGLLLGVLAAVAIDRLTGRVHDEEDGQRESGLPVWGLIPAVPFQLRRSGPVPPSRMPPAASAEFRELAMRMGQSSQDSGTFAILSPTAGDGRTTTAVNLAYELSGWGRGVALVLLDPALDAGVRRELKDAGVLVVDAGAAPLASTLEQARARADLVLVDGPTVARGADLVPLLTPASIVLVARASHTLRAAVAGSLETMRGTGVLPVGLVLLGARGSGARRPGGRLEARTAPHGGATAATATTGQNEPADPPVPA
jgi:succinoglycan biosynthesis transport protein ExoP